MKGALGPFRGAMGSRRAHAQRLEALRKRGFLEDALARIIGPVGLIPAARDPETVALSILGQIAEIYRLYTTRIEHGRHLVALRELDERISVHA